MHDGDADKRRPGRRCLLWSPPVGTMLGVSNSRKGVLRFEAITGIVYLSMSSPCLGSKFSRKVRAGGQLCDAWAGPGEGWCQLFGCGGPGRPAPSVMRKVLCVWFTLPGPESHIPPAAEAAGALLGLCQPAE